MVTGLFVLAAAAQPAPESPENLPSDLLTRAEATDFRETSRYSEVVELAQRLAGQAPGLAYRTFGYTTEGRPLPLVIASELPDPTPEAVRAEDKVRLLVLGNIHAGEVCGKEAALMLLRALGRGEHAAWTDSLVLLVAPLYNADGNERVALTNRPLQNGPVGGMGQRPNAAGLDLNRDFMKADAPETRSLLQLIRDYDPHVLVDLHTTNGTHHGYQLTYAPPLHPGTPAALVRLLREAWLPAVTERMQENGWASSYYGNVPPPGMDAERGWYTFDHRPRFGTNYMGLRNRFAILSEAYAYASFEDRVRVTLEFVEAIGDYAWQHAASIRAAVAEADAQEVAGTQHGVAATYARTGPVDILMGGVYEATHPYTGEPVLVQADTVFVESMPEFGTFRATETVTAPAAYFVPDTLQAVLGRLAAHGIQTRVLAEPVVLDAQAFRVDSVQTAERVYQGHQAVSVWGEYRSEQVTVPPGTVVVPTAQPLGRLAVALLEPRSDDGLLRWGLVPVEGAAYPIWRAATLP